MTTESQPRRSFGRRLWWVLRTTIVTLLVIALAVAVLSALGYGGYVGVIEIQRSFDSLTTRVAANEQNIRSLSQFVDEHVETGNIALEQEVSDLNADVARLQEQLTVLETGLAADVDAQELILQDLEDRMATAVARNSSAAADVAALETALVALQTDINNNSSRIDNVGGEVDQLENEIEGVAAELSETAIAAATVSPSLVTTDTLTLDYSRALLLFRVWNLTTQARFHLLSGAAEAAQATLELARNGLSAYLEGETEPSELLQNVSTRLDLAADSLPADSETALNDILAAWNGLDEALAGMLGGTEGITETVSPTPTAVSAESSTPAPTGEPVTPTVTPTLIPASTPTPTP